MVEHNDHSADGASEEADEETNDDSAGGDETGWTEIGVETDDEAQSESKASDGDADPDADADAEAEAEGRGPASDAESGDAAPDGETDDRPPRDGAAPAEVGSTTSEPDERDRITELKGEIEALEAENEALAQNLAEERAEASQWEQRHQEVTEEFENYKRRREEQMKEEIRQAKAEFVAPLYNRVRSELARIVDEETDDEADRETVRLILEEFDDVLDQLDVEVIDPDPGDEFDFERHESMDVVDADVDGRQVEEIWSEGFAIEGEVLQEAKVVVRQ